MSDKRRYHPKAVYECKKIAKRFGLRLVKTHWPFTDYKERRGVKKKDMDYILFSGKKGRQYEKNWVRLKTYIPFFDEERKEMDDVSTFLCSCISLAGEEKFTYAPFPFMEQVLKAMEALTQAYASERETLLALRESGSTWGPLEESINKVVFESDPMNIAIGANEYEYFDVVYDVVEQLPQLENEEALIPVVWGVFYKYFEDSAGEVESYRSLSEKIWALWVSHKESAETDSVESDTE